MNLNINPNNKEFIKLKTLLKKTNYCNRLEDGLAAKGDPKYFLPILNYCLLHFSAYVADFLLKNNYELFSKNDKEFVKLVILAMINLFNYKPCISLEEFFKMGFSERKSEMCSKIIEIVIKKNEQLEKSNKSLNNGIKKNISNKVISIKNNPQISLNKYSNNLTPENKDTVKLVNKNTSNIGYEKVYNENDYLYKDVSNINNSNNTNTNKEVDNVNHNQLEDDYYNQDIYHNNKNIENFNYPVLNTFGDKDKQLPIDTKSTRNNVYKNEESSNYNNYYEKSNFEELREGSPLPCFNNSSTNNNNSLNTNTNYNTHNINNNNNSNYNTNYKMNTNQFKNNFNYNNEISYLSNIDFNNPIYQGNNQSQLHEADLLDEPKSPDFRDLVNEEEHNLTKKSLKQPSITTTHKNNFSQINDSNVIEKYISNNNSYVNYDKYDKYENFDSYDNKTSFTNQGYDSHNHTKLNELDCNPNRVQSGTRKAVSSFSDKNSSVINNNLLDNGKKSSDVIKPTDINALLELISNLAISVKQMSGRIEDFQSTVEARLSSIEKNVSFLKESNEVLQAENTILKNEVTLLKRNEMVKNSKYDYYEFNDLKSNNKDSLNKTSKENKANSNSGIGPFIVNNGNYIN